MNTTLIAGIVLLAGAAFLLWKGKAALGVELVKLFFEKRLILIEFVMFALIFIHAHTAAELGVKAGADYMQRFLLHSFINFLSFMAAMGLYRNGKDVGAALFEFKGFAVIIKEVVELVAMLIVTFLLQWASLWVMCVGFGRPYIAFFQTKAGEYIGVKATLASLTDFMVASSILIVFSEALMAALLAIQGSASAVKGGSAKSTAKSGESGGFLSGIAGMFGNLVKPQVKQDALAEKVCRILEKPNSVASVSKYMSPQQRITLKGLVAEWDTAQDFQKQSIKSRIERIINE
jgi:hypothetical protein